MYYKPEMWKCNFVTQIDRLVADCQPRHFGVRMVAWGNSNTTLAGTDV